MTPAQVKASAHWPADITRTEDITDEWCPRSAAYILLRPDPKPPAFVTHPRTTTIETLYVIPCESVQAIFDEAIKARRR